MKLQDHQGRLESFLLKLISRYCQPFTNIYPLYVIIKRWKCKVRERLIIYIEISCYIINKKLVFAKISWHILARILALITLSHKTNLPENHHANESETDDRDDDDICSACKCDLRGLKAMNYDNVANSWKDAEAMCRRWLHW